MRNISSTRGITIRRQNKDYSVKINADIPDSHRLVASETAFIINDDARRAAEQAQKLAEQKALKEAKKAEQLAKMKGDNKPKFNKKNKKKYARNNATVL